MRRPSKYRAKPTWVQGIRFPSKREATRYLELLYRQQAGEIAHLELQPRFPCKVGGLLICTYVGDFRFKDLKTGKTIVADAKGIKTPMYRLKKKLMFALYGIEIKEL